MEIVKNDNQLPPHMLRMVNLGMDGADIMHGELKVLMLEAEQQLELAQEAEEESVDDEETEDEETVFNPVFEMELSEDMEEEVVAIPNFEFETEKSSNESFAKTITFGLNDRIAFEKQLFAGSSEDLNRVVSQLSTFDTFEEAQNFIDDMVKPDYDNWEGKEEYVTRFMEIVEKKFA